MARRLPQLPQMPDKIRLLAQPQQMQREIIITWRFAKQMQLLRTTVMPQLAQPAKLCACLHQPRRQARQLAITELLRAMQKALRGMLLFATTMPHLPARHLRKEI